MKRIGSWLLAAVMLLALAAPVIPVVHAEDIQMGALYDMSEDIYNPGDTRIWSFTPGSSGEYLVDSPNGLVVSLDGQSAVSSEGISGYYQVYRLSGGATYTVRATWPASQTDRNQAVVRIMKKEPLQSFCISTTKMTLGKGDTDALSVDFSPYYYSSSAIKWTSSDSNIVSVEGSEGIQSHVKGMNFGTATVTATLGGMQASCTVDVVKPEGEWNDYPLWSGSQNTVTGVKQYRVEPAATGWYVCYLSSGSGYMEMRQTNWVTDLPRKNAHLYDIQYELFYLQAGETYVATVNASGTATAVLQMAQAVKTVTVVGPNNTDVSRIVGAVGGHISLYAYCDPRYAYALEQDGFVFTSSNPSVADFEKASNPGDPGRELVLMGPGSCTVTVSVGNVKTQCQVTVAGQYEFKVGQTTTLKLSGEAYGVTGVFTPEKSGNYRFTMTGTGGTASIEGTDIGTYVNGSGTMSGWLEGGKTYLVNLSFGGSDHTVKVELMDGDKPAEPPKGDGEETTPTAPGTHVQIDQKEETLSREEVEQMVQTGSDMVVSWENVSVNLDPAAVAAVAEAGDGDVTLKIVALDKGALNEKQQAAFEGKAFAGAVEIDLLCGQVDIHDLGGGKAQVKLPFQPEEGYRGEDYQVFWVSEDGQLEEMETTYADGYLSFTTDHFSTFVILRPLAAAAGPSDWWLIPVVAAVVLGAAALVTVFLLKKKKKR